MASSRWVHGKDPLFWDPKLQVFDTWLWVKNRFPKWVALVSGNMEQNQWSDSWFNFDPYPCCTTCRCNPKRSSEPGQVRKAYLALAIGEAPEHGTIDTKLRSVQSVDRHRFGQGVQEMVHLGGTWRNLSKCPVPRKRPMAQIMASS